MKKRTTTDLREAAKRLKPLTPSDVCRGANAEAANGTPVPATSQHAVRWCLNGWIHRETCAMMTGCDDSVPRLVEIVAVLKSAVQKAIGAPDIAHWNDDPRNTPKDISDASRLAAEFFKLAMQEGV